ncbi:MAG TPA: hypothetical protein P5511_09500 [Candidatus Goldiibacteriota bacterium]|nr:hypothetical protein [Candidatus Goldiibacteriota bacterium]
MAGRIGSIFNFSMPFSLFPHKIDCPRYQFQAGFIKKCKSFYKWLDINAICFYILHMKTFQTITEPIRHAIIDAIEHDFDGKNNAFARQVGKHPSTIGKWINPEQSASIETCTYMNKVFPLIKHHLKDTIANLPPLIIPQPPDPCPEICRELGDIEKEWLKRFAKLPPSSEMEYGTTSKSR